MWMYRSELLRCRVTLAVSSPQQISWSACFIASGHGHAYDSSYRYLTALQIVINSLFASSVSPCDSSDLVSYVSFTLDNRPIVTRMVATEHRTINQTTPGILYTSSLILASDRNLMIGIHDTRSRSTKLLSAKISLDYHLHFTIWQTT